MKGDSLVLEEAMKRIRELEAELAGTQSTVRILLDERHEQQARAEKAETNYALAKARAWTAEARVAELTKVLEEALAINLDADQVSEERLRKVLESREREE